MAKKIMCKNCNTEISKDDKKCFNCGELNPTLKSCVVEGIISGVLAILFSKMPLLYVGLTKEKAREILCFGKKAYMLTKDGVFISVNDGTFKKMTEDTIDGDHMFICKKKLYFYSDDIIDICK